VQKYGDQGDWFLRWVEFDLRAKFLVSFVQVDDVTCNRISQRRNLPARTPRASLARTFMAERYSAEPEILATSRTVPFSNLSAAVLYALPDWLCHKAWCPWPERTFLSVRHHQIDSDSYKLSVCNFPQQITTNC
jgi:hypothetical protein